MGKHELAVVDTRQYTNPVSLAKVSGTAEKMVV